MNYKSNQGSNLPIKNIGDDQSYEYRKFGDKRPIIETVYRFFGSNWEEFAVLMARNGLEPHTLTFFIGGSVDLSRKTATIRGAFTHNAWKEKYAERFEGWVFKKGKTRIKLPASSNEYDTLSFEVNGKRASDIWDENFMPVGDGNED